MQGWKKLLGGLLVALVALPLSIVITAAARLKAMPL